MVLSVAYLVTPLLILGNIHATVISKLLNFDIFRTE